MFIADLQLPKVPMNTEHKLIWGLYDVPPGTERPYVYCRLGDTYTVLSRLRPRIPHRKLEVPAGRTYAFDVTCNPTRWMGNRKQGRRQCIIGRDELKAWIRKRVAGADIPFVEAYDRPPLSFVGDGMKKTYHRVRFAGMLYVRDAATFKETLLQGVGRGKFTGLGMIYLPEVMACNRFE